MIWEWVFICPDHWGPILQVEHRLPGHEVTVSPTWKMPSKGPRVPSGTTAHDDTKRGSTNPVLLKPWCFLGKRVGWKNRGGKWCVLFDSEIWSQTNLICINYVVVRFLTSSWYISSFWDISGKMTLYQATSNIIAAIHGGLSDRTGELGFVDSRNALTKTRDQG